MDKLFQRPDFRTLEETDWGGLDANFRKREYQKRWPDKQAIFLGGSLDKPEFHPITTHAMTIAGPRTGKGACQIIPTLRYTWQGNSITIDPKGEAARYAWKDIHAQGREVICIDPIPLPDGSYCSPKPFRHSFNPLDLIRENDDGWEDIKMLTDGLIIPHSGTQDPIWESSAQDIIAGLLALIANDIMPEGRNLNTMMNFLKILGKPEDDKDRQDLINRLDHCTAYGGVTAHAADAVREQNRTTKSFLSTARAQLGWLTDPRMQRALQKSTFDFENFRTNPTAIFLVLPPSALEQHGRFLRLFVRCALAIMKRGQTFNGTTDNLPCLFLLDEFAKLGKMDVIASDLGQMPGYGVHLWPILQYLGQLEALYGEHTTQAFLASDVNCFFGLGNDLRTAEYVSRRIGQITHDHIEDALKEAINEQHKAEERRQALLYMREQDEQREYEWYTRYREKEALEYRAEKENIIAAKIERKRASLSDNMAKLRSDIDRDEAKARAEAEAENAKDLKTRMERAHRTKTQTAFDIGASDWRPSKADTERFRNTRKQEMRIDTTEGDVLRSQAEIDAKEHALREGQKIGAMFSGKRLDIDAKEAQAQTALSHELQRMQIDLERDILEKFDPFSRQYVDLDDVPNPLLPDPMLQHRIDDLKSRVGSPLKTPQEIMKMTARTKGPVANFMVVTTSGEDKPVTPLPYFWIDTIKADKEIRFKASEEAKAIIQRWKEYQTYINMMYRHDQLPKYFDVREHLQESMIATKLKNTFWGNPSHRLHISCAERVLSSLNGKLGKTRIGLPFPKEFNTDPKLSLSWPPCHVQRYRGSKLTFELWPQSYPTSPTPQKEKA